MRFISTGKIWMSLGQSRTDIILDGISSFTYTSYSPLLTVISFLYGVLKPGSLNCAVGKELSNFVSLIVTFLTELILMCDSQIFSQCLTRESFKLVFVNISICSLSRTWKQFTRDARIIICSIFWQFFFGFILVRTGSWIYADQ